MTPEEPKLAHPEEINPIIAIKAKKTKYLTDLFIKTPFKRYIIP